MVGIPWLKPGFPAGHWSLCCFPPVAGLFFGKRKNGSAAIPFAPLVDTAELRLRFLDFEVNQVSTPTRMRGRIERHSVVAVTAAQRPVVARRCAGYRSPSTVTAAAARSISARSSAVSSTSAAPMFSSSRCASSPLCATRGARLRKIIFLKFFLRRWQFKVLE